MKPQTRKNIAYAAGSIAGLAMLAFLTACFEQPVALPLRVIISLCCAAAVAITVADTTKPIPPTHRRYQRRRPLPTRNVLAMVVLLAISLFAFTMAGLVVIDLPRIVQQASWRAILSLVIWLAAALLAAVICHGFYYERIPPDSKKEEG